MSGLRLNKLEVGLILVFMLSLLALLAELCYVLWCRRVFRRQTTTGESDVTSDPFTSPSKELLYFLCWKNQSHIEPARDPSFLSPDAHDQPSESGDLEKLYGPSRVLFTIREEEREELESEKSSSDRKTKKRVSLDGCFGVTEEEASATMTVVIDVGRETPFFTPCASPTYYTPSPSPPREERREDDRNLTHSLGTEDSVVQRADE